MEPSQDDLLGLANAIIVCATDWQIEGSVSWRQNAMNWLQAYDAELARRREASDD
jgi:hypothetical protein